MAQKKYEFLDHTADVEYVAYGATLNAVFKNALLALFDTMADIKKLSKAKTKTKTFLINERARELQDLLWFVLQDAVSVADAEGLYSFGVKKLSIGTELGEYVITATINAKGKNPEFSKLDVKGVSKFDLAVTRKKNRYIAEAVLDV